MAKYAKEIGGRGKSSQWCLSKEIWWYSLKYMNRFNGTVIIAERSVWIASSMNAIS
jgi:hypothetical protein